MSELKRYYAPQVLPERRYHDETEVVLAAEHEDEIARLKEAMIDTASDCDGARLLISEANYIGAFKLIQKISDRLREAAEK